MAQCQTQGELLVTQHPAGFGHGSADRLHRDLPALVARAVALQEQMHPCFLCWWPLAVVMGPLQQWRSQGHFRERSQEIKTEAVGKPAAKASVIFAKVFWGDLLGSIWWAVIPKLPGQGGHGGPATSSHPCHIAKWVGSRAQQPNACGDAN